ncbi:WXG100 family type VII secretion target [Actinokineospora sp. G85]|uniref:WXG100 family type VII secretion target n=1 Tax=Actinokineospora sp. G85 TaxID=3406626 RepID=UPI003C76107D
MSDRNTARMVAELEATDNAVRAKGWVAPGLGVPGAPLGLLESALNPLGGLAAAGLGWFMPMVSFLGEGLTQLQGGNGSSVASGSRDFGDAGQNIGGVAEEYRQAADRETASWSGAAGTRYREAAEQHATGIAGLGQASTGVGSAIIGAGQVVAQAIAEVTELIAEAVAQIVPILTQAIARAGETFGQSVVEAIPPCVGIAVEYALRIAAKLAALVASGDNLMKLVRGGMAVVEMIQQALSGISGQSVDAAAAEGPAGGDQKGGATAAAVDEVSDWAQRGGPGESPATSPASASGGASPTEGVSAPGGTSAQGGGYAQGGGQTPYAPSGSSIAAASAPGGTGAPEVSTRTSGASPLPLGAAVPDTARAVGGGGVPTAAAPTTGGVPFGAGGGHSPTARVGAGRDTGAARPEGRPRSVRATGGGGAPGGVPLGGALGAGGRPGEADKDHQRKFTLVEEHEADLDAAPQVITKAPE